MNRIIVTEPAVEPVTLEELKLHARVDLDDDDDLLTFLIASARQYCESYMRRALINQQWRLTLDLSEIFTGDDARLKRVGVREIDVRQGLIQSISSITTYDLDNSPTIFDPANYTRSFERIVLTSTVSWPADLREFDAIEIVYTVGYGASASEVPKKIKQAIKMLAAYWYESREAIGDMMSKAKDDMIPFSVQGLLLPHKRFVP